MSTGKFLINVRTYVVVLLWQGENTTVINQENKHTVPKRVKCCLAVMSSPPPTQHFVRIILSSANHSPPPITSIMLEVFYLCGMCIGPVALNISDPEAGKHESYSDCLLTDERASCYLSTGNTRFTLLQS